MFYFSDIDTQKVKDLQSKLLLRKDSKGRKIYVLNYKDCIYSCMEHSNKIQGFLKDGSVFFSRILPHRIKERLDFLITLSKIV